MKILILSIVFMFYGCASEKYLPNMACGTDADCNGKQCRSKSGGGTECVDLHRVQQTDSSPYKYQYVTEDIYKLNFDKIYPPTNTENEDKSRQINHTNVYKNNVDIESDSEKKDDIKDYLINEKIAIKELDKSQVNIYNLYESLKNKSLKQGEFEKKSDFLLRKKSAIEPYLENIYSIDIENREGLGDIYMQYNPDIEEWVITFSTKKITEVFYSDITKNINEGYYSDPSIEEFFTVSVLTLPIGSSEKIGQNAYGVKTNFKSSIDAKFYLAIPKSTCKSCDTYKVKLKMPIDEAKKYNKKLKVRVVFKLSDPLKYSNYLYFNSSEHKNATIDFPYEYTTFKYFVNINLIGFVIYSEDKKIIKFFN